MNELYDSHNVFARIIRGELPCRKVAENEQALAFDDLHPRAPVHVLLLPKGAYTDVAHFAATASALEHSALWALLPQVLAAKNVVAGFRLIANSGVNGGQEVPHLHWHLLAGRQLGAMLAAGE